MDKENLQLSAADFHISDDMGIVSTNMLKDDEVESFLSSPDDITTIDQDDENEKSKPQPAPEKKKTSQQPPQKQNQNSQNNQQIQQTSEEEITDDDVVNNALGDEETEENKQVAEKNKDQNQQNSPEDAPDEDDKLSLFGKISQNYIELGIFDDTVSPENIKTPEEFLAAVRAHDERRGLNWVENFFGRFGEDRQELANAVFFNGVEPREYLSQFVELEDLQNLDMTIVGNQERVLRSFYSSLPNWDTNRVEAKMEKLRLQDAIEEEANEKYELLLSQEEQKLHDIEERSKANLAEKQRIQNEYVGNVQRILTEKLKTKDFDGIPITQEFAQATAAYMTQQRYKLPNGELLTEFDKELLELRKPANHELKVKVGMIMQLLKKDPTLSKLKKQAITEQSNELFSNLQRERNDKKKRGGDSVTSWFK